MERRSKKGASAINPWGLLLTILSSLTLVPIADTYGSQGTGLEVSPGALFIQDVLLGELYDVSGAGVPVTIRNGTDSEQRYVLSTQRVSEVGQLGWLHGYSELPDPSWFWFDREDVVVPANSEERVNLYFQIPKEERYYNQHWVVALAVQGANDTAFRLAIFPKIQLETESKEEVSAAPDGVLALEPTVIWTPNVSLGSSRQLTLTLFNNDSQTMGYRLTSKTYPAEVGKLLPISISEGYEWLPDPAWVSPASDRVSVDAGGRARVTLNLEIPDDRSYQGKQWESILFIESDNGLTRFARVRIHTGMSASFDR